MESISFIAGAGRALRWLSSQISVWRGSDLRSASASFSRLTCGTAGNIANSSVERMRDRKSVVSGKSVSVRVDLGGRRILKKKRQKIATTTNERNEWIGL